MIASQEGAASIPGWGTKISYGKKKKSMLGVCLHTCVHGKHTQHALPQVIGQAILETPSPAKLGQVRLWSS